MQACDHGYDPQTGQRTMLRLVRRLGRWETRCSACPLIRHAGWRKATADAVHAAHRTSGAPAPTPVEVLLVVADGDPIRWSDGWLDDLLDHLAASSPGATLAEYLLVHGSARIVHRWPGELTRTTRLSAQVTWADQGTIEMPPGAVFPDDYRLIVTLPDGRIVAVCDVHGFVSSPRPGDQLIFNTPAILDWTIK